MMQTAQVSPPDASLPPATPGESFDPACGYSRLRKITGDCLRPGGLNLTRHGLGRCGFAPGSRILDLGCGPGASLGLLRKLGFASLGLDISRSLATEAAKQGSALRGDFARLPLTDGCLDGILCECALSPARNKAAVLAQCRRTLKKGGLLMLSDITVTGLPHGEDHPPGEMTYDLAAGVRATCASGALSLDGWVDLVRESGFSTLLVENHSRELRALTARLVWEYGSHKVLADFWPAYSPADACRANGPACRPGLKKAGYFLLVGQNNN